MNSRPYELYISLDDITPLWSAQTRWVNEEPLRAALVSLELGFLLIAESAEDSRRTVRQDERVARLWSSAAAQIRLLGDLLTSASPAPDLAPLPPSRATNLRPLCGLASRTAALGVSTRLIRHCADSYDALVEELPFQLGLEPDINRLRAAHGIRERSYRAGAPTLPYDEWAAPRAVAEIFQRRTFNREDRLFASTHQSTECWMFLALRALAAADAAATRRDWAAATQSVSQAAAIMTYLSEAILVLETMVLADYHPLRVRLRDASGAQSRQIAATLTMSRRLLRLLDADLQPRGISYLTIYRRPDAHRAEHGFIEALTTLENRLAAFLFTHYKLAVRVVGAESLGSLGVELQALINHFVQPLYPELDKARYRHSVITGFAYGRHAGSIISDLERAPPEPAPIVTPAELDEDRIRSVVTAYFDAMCKMDLERWVRLFSGRGLIESPAGSRPFHGHHGLRIFFRGFMKTFERDVVMTERAIRIHPSRSHAEVDWQLDVRHGGMPISYTGTERFEFSASGEIERVTVFDEPRDIARQMVPSDDRAACPLEE